MAEPYISEKDVSVFKERMETTEALGRKYNINFNPHENTIFNAFEVLLAVSSERLEKSSKTLERLTIWLIVLNGILAILTGISIWKLLCP